MVNFPASWRNRADAWAQKNGFESAQKLPADKLSLMIDHVARTESASVGEVREAFFSSLFQTTAPLHDSVPKTNGQHVALPQATNLWGPGDSKPKNDSEAVASALHG